MRLDGYVRVSRVRGREGKSFISPDVQRERIRAQAKAAGHQVVRVHEDLDLPGSHSQRPGLQAMLARVERGTVDGVIVARLDRFGRSSLDINRNLERIREAGGELIAAAEGIDTSTPTGRFFLAITAAFAELELERIRETWSVARERAVARGVHIASRTPTGYLRGEDGRLVPGPEAERIAAIFEARAAGASWGELARMMAGVPTPYGGRNWTSKSLAHLIANRVYLGEARSGDFTMPGAHRPLVDEPTWNAAQRPRGPYLPGRGEALLSGLLRCAGCRHVMKSNSMRTRRAERRRIYRCRGHFAAGVCEERPAVMAEIVEDWVTERFFARVGDLEARGVPSNRRLTDARRAVEAARAELEAYRDSAAVAVLGQEPFLAGLRARAEALRGAEARLAEIRGEAELAEVGGVYRLRETWPELSVAERRQLLASAIDAVFLRRVGQANVPVSSRSLVLWRGEAPADLPGRGYGRWDTEIRPFEWPDGEAHPRVPGADDPLEGGAD
jgi:DNA invertase Pin-like site-specific DNA recombinase